MQAPKTPELTTNLCWLQSPLGEVEEVMQSNTDMGVKRPRTGSVVTAPLNPHSLTSHVGRAVVIEAWKLV